MRTEIKNEKDIVKDYTEGKGLEYLSSVYHIGKLRVKKILESAGVEIRKPSCGSVNLKFIVPDWKTKKYEDDGTYYYVAVSKIDGTEFRDIENKGGHLTSYIQNVCNIEIPTLYARRVYYQTTGDYWWEQWFEVEKREKCLTKKCPYCDWVTTDIQNKSGAFELHLKTRHKLTVEDYLKEFPEDADYFKKHSREVKRKNKLLKEDNYTLCPICGEKYRRITISHLSSHNMTMQEFKEKYPDVKILSKEQLEESRQSVKLGNLTVSKDRFVSKYEREIQSFLTSKGVEFEANRQVLIGKEIDILIKDRKIGIEFDGLKWHTEWFGKKSHSYHLNKTVECNKKGYGLIHIFEDEYVNNKEIVFSKLSHILGLDYDLPKIMGRKCVVREIYMNEAKNFLEHYHIQGYTRSSVYLGCFSGEELVAVMSFKNGNIKNPNWELTRFACDYHYRYQGVGSKLFSYFVEKYDPNIIVSFADRRWTVNTDTNLYTNLGFQFDGFTRPDYRYYKDESKNGMKYQRIHKMTFNKKNLAKKYGFPLTMTETEMARELGYDRIWDCGLIKYVWSKNN